MEIMDVDIPQDCRLVVENGEMSREWEYDISSGATIQGGSCHTERSEDGKSVVGVGWFDQFPPR
jgi:hypothetical protein